MTEERITSLIDTVEDCSVEEQEMIVEILEDLQGKFPEVDQVLVRKFKALDHLFGGSDLSESSWRFFSVRSFYRKISFRKSSGSCARNREKVILRIEFKHRADHPPLLLKIASGNGSNEENAESISIKIRS